MTKERNFLRETNIWRLIGLGIALIGGLVAILFPEVIVFHGFGLKASLGVLIMILGFLGFYPTLKEALAKRAEK